MANHDEGCAESQSLCDSLFEALAKRIPELQRGPTEKWCGLYREGRMRFIWVYHLKRHARIKIWCLGNAVDLERRLRSLSYKGRRTAQGVGFGKYYQGSCDLRVGDDIVSAAELLRRECYELS